MNQLDVLTDIQEKDNLLSLPQSLAEVLREVDNPDSSADSMAKIILRDPSLTGRILKMANSSKYKRYGNITTVNQAVQMLGATTVRCLALSSSVFNPDKIEDSTGITAKNYFSTILTVAAGAEKVARVIEYKAPEEAFIAGLLHDIGTMFLMHHYPQEYRAVTEKVKSSGAKLRTVEQAVFGADHCEIGFHLATRWRLPDFISHAIRDHRRPDGGDNHEIITLAVRLATLLVQDSNGAYCLSLEERLKCIGATARMIKMDKEAVDSVSVSLMSATIEAAEYLGVDIGNIEEILSRANEEIWQAYLMIENLFKERQELSQQLLAQERERGAVESKNIAMATLSHYLNNATMAIYGRSQMMRMHHKREQNDKLIEKTPEHLDVIDRSIQKIVAVLTEMKDISPMDEKKFLSTSRALNMDDRIKRRMEELESDSGMVIPEQSFEAAS